MSPTKKMKKKRKPRREDRGKSAQQELIADPRAAEKTISQIGRLLDEQEFSSIEEANAFLQEVTKSGNIPPVPTSTPLESAQDIMYEAWGSRGDQRVELARKALEISEYCADAYVLLAEETASSLEESKNLYERGMKAGEKALGPKMFKKEAGHFWGIVETRPYMRARAGLAAILWMQGEHEKAIKHYADMLRLNPNDNQGIRETLMNCLLEVGNDRKAVDLLEEYEDDISVCWAFSRALLAFRASGGGGEANKYLEEAVERNPHVPQLLTGRKRMPKHLPQYYSFGDKNEAVDYVIDAIMVWTKTEGAIGWLRGRTEKR